MDSYKLKKSILIISVIIVNLILIGITATSVIQAIGRQLNEQNDVQNVDSGDTQISEEAPTNNKVFKNIKLNLEIVLKMALIVVSSIIFILSGIIFLRLAKS